MKKYIYKYIINTEERFSADSEILHKKDRKKPNFLKLPIF